MNNQLCIMVGLSGGVDSSVAAYRLLQQGHHVEALFMKNWEEDDDEDYCAAHEDLADAEAVCRQLDIRLHTANFSTEYWDRVFEHFLAEYQAQRTPNPDIICNSEIKFKEFPQYAKKLGAQYIATGHYVRCRETHQGYQLLKGIDQNKDQSYFLYRLNQQQLSVSMFPLGDLHKPAVRKIAEQQKFVNAKKKDSTGICFIGERKFRDFLRRYIPAQPGVITDPKGNVLGEHQGLMYYTLGQRQGLGIGGTKGDSGAPWYVAQKDVAGNRLVVVQGNKHPLLYGKRITIGDIHWIGNTPAFPLECKAKIRYRHIEQECRVDMTDEQYAQVDFSQAQWAPTPGQSMVFYQHDVCLGGGIIQRSIALESGV